MWKENQVTHYTFAEREAIVVRPEEPNGLLVWKAEYFAAFQGFEEAMVERGYTLCYVGHPTRWAPDSELDVVSAFLRSVAERYDLDPRVIAVGMSCGGLLSTKFAEKYPEQIGVLYLDAPVLNILSMLGMGEAAFSETIYRELSDTYGLSRSTAVNFRESPIDNLAPLIAHDIPVILLYGNADEVVIYAENGRVLEDYYRTHSGRIKVICRSMCGHHPHGLDDPQPIIDFVEREF